MKKKYKKHIIYIGIFFLITAVSLSLIYLQIKKNYKKLKEINSEYDKEENRRKEIRFLNDVLSETENEVNYFNSHFITDSEVIGFFGEIEEIAKQVGVEAEVVFAGEPGVYKKGISIGVDIRGNFEPIYKFILLLENSKYELKIDSVEINKGIYKDKDEEITYITWKGNLVLRILSFISNEEIDNEKF